ncbi:DUF7344 domain-containing protein [Natronosalvus rutilus]|uniref:DUF7344 domain-containing protein n=1 Tax=Natronosalvus rutilus TaxID=2953753 RepID=A0A9E7SV76_9EURY|nr:hypothetical protein [Natronosalvus rutilus]UTF52003.1 hypothetical protein NGM29_09285 [Natronosalvus rutilus]
MLATNQKKSRIDPKEIHDILRNSRRRHVIRHLEARLTPVTLRELSERIAELETGESPAPRNVRESVYNSLHQTHLPKLDALGVIEYDDDRKTVELRDSARQVDLYMEVVMRHGISWAGYYRTLGVLALVTVVATSAGVPFLSTVPTVLTASAFLVVFAISTAYQLWTRRWFYLHSLVANVSPEKTGIGNRRS